MNVFDKCVVAATIRLLCQEFKVPEKVADEVVEFYMWEPKP